LLILPRWLAENADHQEHHAVGVAGFAAPRADAGIPPLAATRLISADRETRRLRDREA
jgi:hypothetical protein